MNVNYWTIILLRNTQKLHIKVFRNHYGAIKPTRPLHAMRCFDFFVFKMQPWHPQALSSVKR